jgi:hypothetical protein
MAQLDAQAEWVARVLHLKLPLPVSVASNANLAPTATGMAGWTQARDAALKSLKLLENAFRAMKEPESDPAIILLRAIQANLTAVPATQAQVNELISFITTDDIIASAEQPNGFGFKVELRKPLLAALQGLKLESEPAQGATV